MNHLELHMLQSVPVSCLNRDDLNSPKTAIFGGVQRARVSSQCWKRAIREYAKDSNSQSFRGNRTKLVIEKMKNCLMENKINETDSQALSFCIGHYLAKIDPKDTSKVKTLLYLSDIEYKNIADKISNLSKDKQSILIQAYSTVDISKISDDDISDEQDASSESEGDADKIKTKKSKDKISPKQFSKIISKGLKPVFKDYNKSSLSNDAADIALFGRMVANDANINIDGAAMFSHAISTHKVDNEIDFFTAIDDLQPDEEAGAGMMGTLEFNSASYYRFAALNLDMLADESHLSAMSLDDRKKIVETFIKSTLMAMPGARKGSMNGNTLPGYVMCVVRSEGHPIQLVNAFERPVNDKNGVFDKSVELLKAEYNKLKTTWDLNEVSCISLPDKTLKELLKEVLKHVK